LATQNTDAASAPLGMSRAEGFIKNVNTFEQFKSIDKGAIMQSAGEQVCPCSL